MHTLSHYNNIKHGIPAVSETEHQDKGRTVESAILPGMPRRRSAKPLKPRVVIVGAGNLARALAVALQRAGYRIDQIVSRDRPPSLRRARRLAGELGASAVKAAKVHIQAELVWFCVPDGAIAAAATALQGAADWSGKVALHSSGALTSDELAKLRIGGAAVASVHPMMTFVRGSRPRWRACLSPSKETSRRCAWPATS